MPGRLTKLTSERHKKICDLLRAGNTRTCAAGAAGVEPLTFRNWYAKGEREQSGPFFTFFTDAARAEHEAEAMYVTVIAKAAKDGDWRAAESYLKRRHREDWGDNVAFDVDKEITNIMAVLAGSRESETA